MLNVAGSTHGFPLEPLVLSVKDTVNWQVPGVDHAPSAIESGCDGVARSIPLNDFLKLRSVHPPAAPSQREDPYGWTTYNPNTISLA